LTIEGDADGRALRLMAQGPAPHYRALVSPGGSPGLWQEPADLEPLAKPEVYDGELLFHGPAFQALDSAVRVADSGAAAGVLGLRARGWPQAPWATDPVAVDGALQLTALWAEKALGGATLPMRIEEFRWYRPGAIQEPLRCVVRGRSAQQDQAVCDVALLEGDGAVRAELFGVTLIKRPDLVRS
jgi:hypothetical protein